MNKYKILETFTGPENFQYYEGNYLELTKANAYCYRKRYNAKLEIIKFDFEKDSDSESISNFAQLDEMKNQIDELKTQLMEETTKRKKAEYNNKQLITNSPKIKNKFHFALWGHISENIKGPIKKDDLNAIAWLLCQMSDPELISMLEAFNNNMEDLYNEIIRTKYKTELLDKFTKK